jgi:exopolysaccharide biosynthesis polyprenyl glycosylphosphotransferase
MLFRYKRVFHVGFEILDISLVVWTLLLANALCEVRTFGDLMRVPDAPCFWQLVLYVAASALVWWILAVRLQLYRSRRTSSFAAEILLLTRLWVLTVAVPFTLASVVWDRPPVDVRRALLFGLLVFTVERISLRSVLASLRAAGRNTRRLIVVGWGGPVEALRSELRANPHFGVLFEGLVAFDDESLPGDLPVPVLGRLSGLERVIADQAPQMVLITPSEQIPMEQIGRVFKICDQAGLPCAFLPPFTAGHLRPRLDDFAGVPTIAFVPTQFGSGAALVKRAFDVVLALLLLIPGAVLILVFGILIKREDGGPVLFRQKRVGRFGELFTCLKFRSMVVDADARKVELLAENEQDGPAFKMSNDPRVTRIGRFLRRYSLDELPQLWNVLVGDMSFVGPRPPTPDEVQKYQWAWRRRLSVRPGLTCIWQIWGRNEVSFQRWMEMDLWYIDTWSLWKDVKLILRTVSVVLRGTGR